MKKHIPIIYIVIIAALAVSCFVLWQNGKTEHAKMEDLCQGSVKRALEFFKEYASEGNEELYTYGVAEFRSFMNTYTYLNDEPTDLLYAHCNAVYGQMAIEPDNIKANMPKLIEALEILAKDHTAPNGELRMGELTNLLSNNE